MAATTPGARAKARQRAADVRARRHKEQQQREAATERDLAVFFACETATTKAEATRDRAIERAQQRCAEQVAEQTAKMNAAVAAMCEREASVSDVADLLGVPVARVSAMRKAHADAAASAPAAGDTTSASGGVTVPAGETADSGPSVDGPSGDGFGHQGGNGAPDGGAQELVTAASS